MNTRKILWMPFAGLVAIGGAAALCGEVPAAATRPVAKSERKMDARAADFALEGRVKVALSATLGVPAQEIGVAARDGAVLLFGAVRSAAAREGAGIAATRVPGVKAVDNGLTIVKGS